MISVNAIIYCIQPNGLDEQTTYNSVFLGIINNKETDGKYLNELGLPPKFTVLAGTNVFQVELPIDIKSDEFRKEFYNKIGKSDILIFYMKHPDLLIKNMISTGELAFMNKPDYLGNKTKDFSEEKMSADFFSGYSIFKKWIIPHKFSFIFLFFMLYIIVAIYLFIRKKHITNKILCMYCICLIVFCSIQYILPTVGNGGHDTAKQLYMFNTVFDLLLFNILYQAALFIAKLFPKDIART
jgi:hypothetical protein